MLPLRYIFIFIFIEKDSFFLQSKESLERRKHRDKFSPHAQKIIVMLEFFQESLFFFFCLLSFALLEHDEHLVFENSMYEVIRSRSADNFLPLLFPFLFRAFLLL